MFLEIETLARCEQYGDVQRHVQEARLTRQGHANRQAAHRQLGARLDPASCRSDPARWPPTAAKLSPRENDGAVEHRAQRS
jgi:hypothetical protein